MKTEARSLVRRPVLAGGVLACLLLGSGGVLLGKEGGVKKEYIDPSQGFTHVVTASHAGLKTIYVSGQVGWAEGAGEPGKDLGEQAALALENLAKRLASAGATKDDIVKLNVYIKDIDPEKVRAVGAAQAQFFKDGKFPAATWVGITGLVYPSLLVEIEAVALVTE